MSFARCSRHESSVPESGLFFSSKAASSRNLADSASTFAQSGERPTISFLMILNGALETVNCLCITAEMLGIRWLATARVHVSSAEPSTSDGFACDWFRFMGPSYRTRCAFQEFSPSYAGANDRHTA